MNKMTSDEIKKQFGISLPKDSRGNYHNLNKVIVNTPSKIIDGVYNRMEFTPFFSGFNSIEYEVKISTE